MEWNDCLEKLPTVNSKQGARCLAYCLNDVQCWKGYVDVFFHPTIGWRRCENCEPVCVLKWIEIEQIGNEPND